jgi:ankyrin repeat protein
MPKKDSRGMSLSTSDLMALDKGGELLDAMKEDVPNRRHITACIAANYPIDQQDMEGFNVVSVAASRGFAPEMELLIKRGARIEHTDKKGRTPLILAAENGHLDVVKLLITADAQPDATDRDGQTAAIYALMRGFSEIVHFLVAAGATPPPVDLSVDLKHAIPVFAKPLQLRKKP